jgi:hypothetical protein
MTKVKNIYGFFSNLVEMFDGDPNKVGEHMRPLSQKLWL